MSKWKHSRKISAQRISDFFSSESTTDVQMYSFNAPQSYDALILTFSVCPRKHVILISTVHMVEEKYDGD